MEENKKKINIWQITTIMFALLFILAIFNVFSYNGSTNKITGNAVSYLNENVLAQQGVEATLVSSEKLSNGLIKAILNLNGQINEIYISPDGKLLFPGAISLTEEVSQKVDSNQQTQNIPKLDKPKVELFVMSHCPYGTQMEKGIYPVINLLKDKIDFDLKFVSYSMHGETEVKEQLNQYCIQKEQNDKFLPYLKCFLEDGDGKRCLEEVGIDMNALSQCTFKLDEEFEITKNLEDKSLWLNGNFPLFNIYKEDNVRYGVQGSPTLIINGEQASTGRDSVSLLSTICDAFNVAPEECNTVLEAGTPSPGFGWTESDTSNIATCSG